MNAYDHMKNLTETIWDDHIENLEEKGEDEESALIIQMSDLERGSATEIEINSLQELENSIISVRLIAYEQTIR